MRKSTIEKATRLLAHGQRIRNYMLGGDQPDSIWKDLPKEPTVSQIRTLLALNFLGECPLKILATRLGVSRPAASEMVDRLVEMNFVMREQNPDDRRQIIIRLTPDARRRVEAHESRTLKRIGRIMEKLDSEMVERWIETSEIIAGTIDDIEREAERRPGGRR